MPGAADVMMCVQQKRKSPVANIEMRISDCARVIAQVLVSSEDADGKMTGTFGERPSYFGFGLVSYGARSKLRAVARV